MIKLKPVEQSPSMCGPASLSSLLYFYGHEASEAELAKLCNSTVKDGTEPEALVEALKTLGYKVVAKQNGSWEELKDLVSGGTPVLVDWWSDFEEPHDGHYSLIYEVSDNGLSIMDPEIGAERYIPKDKFLNQWYDFYLDGRTNYRWYLYIVK